MIRIYLFEKHVFNIPKKVYFFPIKFHEIEIIIFLLHKIKYLDDVGKTCETYVETEP